MVASAASGVKKRNTMKWVSKSFASWKDGPQKGTARPGGLGMDKPESDWRTGPVQLRPFASLMIGLIALVQAVCPAELNLSAPSNTVSRAKVVVIEHHEAMRAFNPQPTIVASMVSAGLIRMTGTSNINQAWRALVSTNDILGIKVDSEPGALSGTRPAVVAAVVRGLQNAGMPPAHIFIWDKQMASLEASGYTALAQQLGVRIAASNYAGYETNRSYENPILGQLVWGDLEFGNREPSAGRKSHLSSLLARRFTKIINIAPLLNHNHAGISGLLYGLGTASVDNILRFEGSADRLAAAIPEIIAMPEVGDRVVLNIIDALIAQYQGEQRGLLHYSSLLNQLWFSTDPVALDVLGISELQNQRQKVEMPRRKISLELYENAALLEIGVADERRILVDLVRLDAPAR